MAKTADSIFRGPIVLGIVGLLRKDLAVFIPRDRALLTLVYLLAHPMVLPNEEAFFWLGICLAGALALYVPTLQWHQETDRMMSSLPLRRTTVVFSRYLASGLACGVAGVAWVSTGRILAPVLDAGFTPPAMWTTFEGTLTFFLMSGLLLSLFLPLYFRFGLGKGALVFMGLSFGLYVLASVPSGIIIPGRALETVVGNLNGRVGTGWALVLVLGGLGAVVAGSGGLSARWFERRDL